ncbi:MAG: hypothetical protein RR685_08005 [Hungatella sp.]
MKFEFISGDERVDIQDIHRCLMNILSIPEGSIPLARGLGLRWANLSQMPPELENDMATEIVEKVERSEPRVSVNEVLFSYDTDGMVTVTIELEGGIMDGNE